jgi:hypothetical protein
VICILCKGEMLPAVQSGEVDGDLFRCSSCGRWYELVDKTRDFGPRPPPPSDLATSTLEWSGHLELDGSVTFSCCGTGSPDEARRANDALTHLAYLGEQRRKRLRGGDRWVFRRDAFGTFRARYDQEEMALKAWRSGGRRPDRHGNALREQSCDACRAELPKGALGYRAVDPSSNWPLVSWRDVRFCAACVEAAPAATATGRPALSVLDGGKARLP